LRIGAGPEQASFRIEATRPDEPGSVAVVVDLGERPARAATVDAVAVRGGTPIAHLRLVAGPDVKETLRLTSDHAEFGALAADDVHIETVLVDGEHADASGDVWRWRLWLLDPSVAELP
jgi:hypothetical protein